MTYNRDWRISKIVQNLKNFNNFKKPRNYEELCSETKSFT